MTDGGEPSGGHEPGLVDELSGVARLAADACLRTASWGFGRSIRAGGRLARAAVDPTAAAQLAGEVGEGVRGYARQLLGISELDERVKQLLPANGDRPARAGERGEPPRGPSALSLREQGAALLRQSNDVEHPDETHPAFARILGELAPDEGRILRMLAVDGPHPAVDVRSAGMAGIGSAKIASNLNMVGALAGCRHVERVQAYLENLQRLGLIWFSHEVVADPIRYQVLEAQPAVMQAMKRAGRVKTVHRSIRLTEFGSDFCRACLPITTPEFVVLTSEADALTGDGNA